ncbi:MlaC/ttg2D family ABC transporter substrate-binding protein [Alloyangia pacifica]|uniref:Phospholipid transport system substrate-binding protein n=1 Tax=Alloyangia pacifica TaxID=311180 RepID=A0A1I6V6R5_9RHOB|nr:ABC transporter substrate-binding protein [Alloyangia pacifica]SDH91680.1 phospholipid transport system substrate-binding protein [Alloyangia pacifica]SFT09326.1 phospholipid transport system substrate-binding protein [Alloyangia pacifica]
MAHFTNRRGFLVGALGAVALGTLPGVALAASAAQAERLVQGLVGDVNAVIASGASEAAMIAEFERIFARYGDMPYIAAYVMGADGRRASGPQKKAFTAAFQGYAARKYGKQFRKFIGGQIRVEGTQKVKNAYQVATTADLRGQAPFEVTFFVGEKSGRFYNMYVEGVNMLLTERTEIGAMLDRRRGDIDAMIADLRRAG